MSSIIEQITNRKLVLTLKSENLALKSELERLFGRVDELISDIEALKSRLNPEEEKQ